MGRSGRGSPRRGRQRSVRGEEGTPRAVQDYGEWTLGHESVREMGILRFVLILLVWLVGSPMLPAPRVLAVQNGNTSGAVTIDLRGMPVREGDVLSVAVTNGLTIRIWGTSHETNCSFVILQKWTGSLGPKEL